MEQKIKKIIMLLEEKKLIFERYEALTDKLSETSDTDATQDYITKRAELANKIDALDNVIKKLLEEASGEEGMRVLEQSYPREALPEGLRQVYDSNLSIMEVVRRIRLKNSDITAGYERDRAEAMEKIKAASNMPKVNRYLNNLSTREDTNNFGSV
ncbi:MAG: hypothetical protein RRY54_00195 [Angelakisella sp.]